MKRRVFYHAPLRKLTVWLCAALLLGQLAPISALGQTTTPPAEADVVRFLEQATWGPTDALITRVQSIGYEAWLREQFSAPVSGLEPSTATSPIATTLL